MDNRSDNYLNWCVFPQLVGITGIDPNRDGFNWSLSSISAVWNKHLQDKEQINFPNTPTKNPQNRSRFCGFYIFKD